MTITCTILLFAQLTDTVGESQLEIQLSANATVAIALDALIQQYPSLQQHRRTLAVAVNERYAGFETLLRHGDTIALIPPVSGG